jgi:hypothetical protein
MNVALKQLVWTADTFMPTRPSASAEWIEIRSVKEHMVSQPHLAGMKKVVLARSSEVDSSEEK